MHTDPPDPCCPGHIPGSTRQKDAKEARPSSTRTSFTPESRRTSDAGDFCRIKVVFPGQGMVYRLYRRTHCLANTRTSRSRLEKGGGTMPVAETMIIQKTLKQIIEENIRKAGKVTMGLQMTADQTGRTYSQIQNYYYKYVRPKKCFRLHVPKSILQADWWTRADYMVRLYEQGECLDNIAKAFDVEVDTVKKYIRLAVTFPQEYRTLPTTMYRYLIASNSPLKAVQVVSEIANRHGKNEAWNAVQKSVKIEDLTAYLRKLDAQVCDTTPISIITELQKQNDFYFRRMKALERINQQYVKTLQKLIDKEKSQKEFQREYGLKALEDQVFNEFSPSLVELRKKCRTLDDISDYYKFLMFLERLLNRKKGGKIA